MVQRQNKIAKIIVIVGSFALCFIILVVAFLFLIFSYERDIMLIAPGEVTPVDDTISIRGYSSINEFNTVSVSVIERPTVFESIIFNLMFGHVKKAPMSDDYEHIETDDLSKGSRLTFESSKYTALVSAYNRAEMDIDYNLDGFYITYYQNKDYYNDSVKIGDVLTEVDDVKIESRESLSDTLNDGGCSRTVELTIENENGIAYDILVPLQKRSDNTCFLGLSLYEKISILDSTTPYPTVRIPDNVGGPSGGLMSSLQIYETLTQESLVEGYKIAGTGTIDLNGNVGEIGAADLKIITSLNNDVDVFFVPTGNYEEAKKGLDAANGKEITIVAVDTLDEAIEYLENLPNK